MFDGFATKEVHGKPKERQKWAENQLMLAAKARRNLGLNALGSFSGALLWHPAYPWPQLPAGLAEDGFAALARLWTAIVAELDEQGADVCQELRTGTGLHGGVTFERFL